MLRIYKHPSIVESKGEFTAKKILNQLTLKESFSVNDYFKSKTSRMPLKKQPSKLITPSTASKKSFYDYWEIKDSLRQKSSYRLRKRDVVEKLKFKTNVLKPIDFKLSDSLQKKLTKFKTLKFL